MGVLLLQKFVFWGERWRWGWGEKKGKEMGREGMVLI